MLFKKKNFFQKTRSFCLTRQNKRLFSYDLAYLLDIKMNEKSEIDFKVEEDENDRLAVVSVNSFRWERSQDTIGKSPSQSTIVNVTYLIQLCFFN